MSNIVCTRCGNELDEDQCMSCHMVQEKPKSLYQTISAVEFPITSNALRVTLVNNFEKCPECNRDLDTGYECNGCGFDATSLVRKP